MASILRQGIALSVARYIEQVIMLLTPIVLVRTIEPQHSANIGCSGYL